MKKDWYEKRYEVTERYVTPTVILTGKERRRERRKKSRK